MDETTERIATSLFENFDAVNRLRSKQEADFRWDINARRLNLTVINRFDFKITPENVRKKH